MLEPDDAALVAREREIPGLALLLDPEALAELVAGTPFATRLAKAKPRYIRFKPGTRALAAFTDEPDFGSVSFYAIAHGPDAASKFSMDAHQSTVAEGPIHFPSHALSLFPFPWDRRLHAVGRLATQRQQTRLLERIFPNDPGLASGHLEGLAYKPERRFVARLRTKARGAVLKFHGAAGFYAAWTRSDALRRAALPGLPEILGRSRKHRVIAYRWRDGSVLRDQLGKADGASALEATGAALAEFHQRSKALVALSERAALPELGESAQALKAIAPQQSVLIEAVEKRLHEGLECFPAAPVFCHGDFYAKQVLVSPDGVDILDFDRAGWADAHSDLGVFWAHLERDALSSRSDGDPTEHLEALLRGYRQIRPVDRKQLARNAAAALYSIAVHPFRSREDEWHERTMALVRRADAILESASVSVFAAPAAHETPYLSAALDPALARREIAAALGPRFPKVEAGVLLRHKPGRRALLRYPISPQNDASNAWLGKIRAKGLDRRAYATYCKLFGRVEGSPSALPFALPSPIGAVPALGMWLQSEERGWPSAALLGGVEGARAARAIADALFALHAMDFESPKPHSALDEWTILETRLRRATDVLPEFRGRIEAIAGRCQILCTRLATAGHTTGIHRDFYPDQVLIYGDRIVLLDFDLCSRGDPALDIGNFVAHLEELSLREPERAAALCKNARVFLERYLSRSDDPDLRRRAESYRTLSLARHIDISTQIPERSPITELLVALCEDNLSIPCPVEKTS